MSEDIRPGGTYKTLDEQREVLSPAEETVREKATDDRALPRAAVFLDDDATCRSGFPDAQQTLAAVLAFVIVYWVSEAIPIPVTAVVGWPWP